MAAFLRKNFASGSLASGITALDLSITLSAGHNLPTSAGTLVLTIWNSTLYQEPPLDPNVEVVTASYSGTPNVYSIVRAQESTTAHPHVTGDTASMFYTAGISSDDIKWLGSYTVDETGVGANKILNLSGGSIKYTDSPTVAALTITGLTGVLKATTGLVSGSAVHGDLGGIGAGDHHAVVSLATSADVLLGLTGQALSLDTQAATYVLVGPTTGAAAAPTFRALLATDIPALTYEVPLSFSTGLNRNVNTITCNITQYTDLLARAAISEIVTGLSYDNSTGEFSLTSGYVIPTTTEESNWNTAYGWADATDEPTGFVDRVATLSWSDAALEFTITGNHDIYIAGVKTTKTTVSKTIADTTGLHWIYYNASGVISESTTQPGFAVPWIASVYWNTTTNKGLLADERHGIVMDWATHELLHETVGTRWNSGLAGTFANTTFSIATGEINDEDLSFVFAAPMTTCNVLYKNGAAEFEWDAAATLYYKLNTTTLRYNNVNALADVTNNYHVAYWIFATNDVTLPIISLMGQRQDQLLTNARTNNKYESLTFGTLPYAEMKLLYRVIIKNASGTATFVEAQDLRSVSNLPAGTYIASQHNALTGLEWSLAGHNDTNFNVNHNADGRVGIGTTAPAYILQIIENLAGSSAIQLMNINEAGGTSHAFLSLHTRENGGNPQVGFGIDDSNGVSIDHSFHMGIDNADLDKFKISQGNLSAGPKITITQAGLVGIGNIDPTTLLDVTGVVTAAGLAVDTTTLYVNSATHRVGIGTTSPERALHVIGDGAEGTFALQRSSTDNNPASINCYKSRGTNASKSVVTLNDATGGFVAYGWDGDSWVPNASFTGIVDGTVSNGVCPGAITINTGSTAGVLREVARFTTGLRVGIRVTAPLATLHIDAAGTTGAIPVLLLDQGDVSEEFIRFIGTSANGVLTQSIVEAADVATATLAGYVKVYVQDDGNQLTDQAYFVPVYVLA